MVRVDVPSFRGARSTVVRTHRDLEAWKKAIALTASVYETTRHFPREERYGITSQMNRAAVSIPSSIAEGAARGSQKDFGRFLLMARGSVSELETLAVVARKIDLLSAASSRDLHSQIDHVAALLEGLLKSLRSGGQT